MKLTIDGREVACRDGATHPRGRPRRRDLDPLPLRPSGPRAVRRLPDLPRRGRAAAGTSPRPARRRPRRARSSGPGRPRSWPCGRRSSSSSWPSIPTPASSARRRRPATTSSPRSARPARSPDASSARRTARCELQKVADEVGLEKVDLPAVYRNLEVRREDPFFDRDYNLCILCGRCIRVCEEVRGAVRPVLHPARRPDGGGHGLRPDAPRIGLPVLRGLRRRLPHRGPRRKGRPAPAPRRRARRRSSARSAARAASSRSGSGRTRVVDATPVNVLPNHGQACVKGRFLVRGALSGPDRILEPTSGRTDGLEPASMDEALDRAAAGLMAAVEGRRALVYPVPGLARGRFSSSSSSGARCSRRRAMAAAPAPAVETALDAFAAKYGRTVPADRELSGIGDCGSVLAWDIDLPDDHPIAWLEVVRAVRRGAGFVAAGQVPAGPVGRAAVKLDLASGGLPRPRTWLRPCSTTAAATAAGIDGFDDFEASARRPRPRARPDPTALSKRPPALSRPASPRPFSSTPAPSPGLRASKPWPGSGTSPCSPGPGSFLSHAARTSAASTSSRARSAPSPSERTGAMSAPASKRARSRRSISPARSPTWGT